MKLQLNVIRKWGQTALYSAAGVLGIAVVLGLSEPAPASAAPVTPDDVRLISEQTLHQNVPQAGKNGNSNEYGRRGRTTLRG